MTAQAAARNVRVTRSRRPQPALAIVGMAVIVGLAAMPAVVDAGTTATLVDVFTLLAMATMWNLLAGYAGLVSIGQQAWVGIGAYTVLVLAQQGVPPFLAVPLAAVVCAILALPASWFLFRLRGGYFAIATWVVADTIRLLVNTRKELGGGTGAILPGISGIDPTTRLAWTYWVALAVAVVTLGVTWWLLRGRIGLVLTAIRDNEIGARSVGANVLAAKRAVFLVSAAGTGLAGTLLILSQLNVQAASVFSVGWSAKIIFIAVIGGMGSIEGPILGTALYFLLQTLLAQYGAWYFVALGTVAIVIALWAPGGLWGVITDRLHVRVFPVGYWLWGPDEPTGGGAAPEPGDA